MIELVPSQPHDLPFLFEVYAASREEELSVAPWSVEEKDGFLRMQFHAQDTYYKEHVPDTRFDLIVKDGVAIGRYYVLRRETCITVVDIALLANYRGQGIGGALIRELLDEAAPAGKPVRLHVEHNNRARNLYDRLGFHQIGTYGVYYELEWNPGPGRADTTGSGAH